MRKRRIALLGGFAALALAAVALADPMFHEAKPSTFDPAKTFLVASGWHDGIGCPTNAGTSSNGAKKPDGTYTDPACTTGDPKDNHNQGLLMAKTGPSSNFAEGVVELKDVKGITLTELGYDLRKPGVDVNDPRGSHCDNGSPLFQVVTTTGFFQIGCRSPLPDSTVAGNGWLRLRWGGSATLMGFNGGITPVPVTGTVQQIFLVFQDGQDTGPDNFGLAVMDNLDVNGTLVGRGDHGE